MRDTPQAITEPPPEGTGGWMFLRYRLCFCVSKPSSGGRLHEAEISFRLTNGSWQVFHIVGLCVFFHQSADYSIVVAHLTSNIFGGHPCCMHAEYLPSLCF
jgi:hypothetical protein